MPLTEDIMQDKETMRLQKYLAICGAASRRAAEEMIREGRVKVDGETIREMGVQVTIGQAVELDGRLLTPEPEKRYIMYHKPAGEVTTVSDPEGRPTALDHFRDFPVRLYPVGRLDYDSEGLLLLTNDGDLTQRLLHPSYEVHKSYLARVSNHLSPEALKKLETGVYIDGAKTSPATVRVVREEPFYTDIVLTIHEGRNRQVRKMIEQVGEQVVRLRRIRFGPLSLDQLPRGQWRELTEREVAALKRIH